MERERARVCVCERERERIFFSEMDVGMLQKKLKKQKTEGAVGREIGVKNHIPTVGHL